MQMHSVKETPHLPIGTGWGMGEGVEDAALPILTAQFKTPALSAVEQDLAQVEMYKVTNRWHQLSTQIISKLVLNHCCLEISVKCFKLLSFTCNYQLSPCSPSVFHDFNLSTTASFFLKPDLHIIPYPLLFHNLPSLFYKQKHSYLQGQLPSDRRVKKAKYSPKKIAPMILI